MTPEGKIKDKVKRALARLSVPVYSFMPVQNGMGKPGLDFYLCINGKFIAIETKAGPKGKLTPRQLVTANEIARAGGLSFLVFDDDTLSKAIATICNVCQVTYERKSK